MMFIKRCPPCSKHHLYQRWVSIKQTICVNEVLEHGGTMFYRLKMGGGGSLQYMKYRYSQRVITSMVNFFDKTWNFAYW